METTPGDTASDLDYTPEDKMRLIAALVGRKMLEWPLVYMPVPPGSASYLHRPPQIGQNGSKI
jgi:hypothetical protein